jgi:hypothetical protein
VRVEACAGDACQRSLALEFAPDLHGAYQPALVQFSDGSIGGAAPVQLVSAAAGAKLLPAPSLDLLAGAFVAVLRSADASGPELRVRGYFQASPSDSPQPVIPP